MSRTVFHGDCLEVMKTLPDKSIDLFLCDLPYGCLAGVTRNVKAHGDRVMGTEYIVDGKVKVGCAWDIKLDLAQFWTEVKRLCKTDHTPILHFCSTKFGNDLINSNPDWFRYDLVWNKMRGVSFLSANKMPMRSHEMVYVFSKKGATYYRTDITGEFHRSHTRGKAKEGTTNTYNKGKSLALLPQPDNSTTRCVLSVVDVDGNGRTKGKHPTQKPDDLYEWLITRYSKEGDTILDPTAGSFASINAAVRLNRNAIGIEKDDDFFQRFSSGEQPK
jgi:DNA modification methylase